MIRPVQEKVTMNMKKITLAAMLGAFAMPLFAQAPGGAAAPAPEKKEAPAKKDEKKDEKKADKKEKKPKKSKKAKKGDEKKDEKKADAPAMPEKK